MNVDAEIKVMGRTAELCGDEETARTCALALQGDADARAEVEKKLCDLVAARTAAEAAFYAANVEKNRARLDAFIGDQPARASERRAEAIALGASERVAVEYAAQTSSERHAWRIRATIAEALWAAACALGYDDDDDDDWDKILRVAAGSGEDEPWWDHAHQLLVGSRLGGSEKEIVQVATLLIATDICGVGGHRGLTGDATTRQPWARQLGAGRWHARDGGAWRSAAAQAFADLNEAARIWAPCDDPTSLPSAAIEGDLVGHIADLAVNVPAPWRWVFATRAALAAIDGALRSGGGRPAVAIWSKVADKAAAERRGTTLADRMV